MNIKYLENLAEAKESVKVFLSNLEQVNFGNPMFEKANELDKNNTEFARWYYGEGQVFSSFDSFKILETFYNDMYDTFLTYMDLKDKPVKKSLFTNEVKKRQTELEELFQLVKQNARKLIKSIDLFEEKLKTSPLFEEYQPQTVYDFSRNLNVESPKIENEEIKSTSNLENLIEEVKISDVDEINPFEKAIQKEWLEHNEKNEVNLDENIKMEVKPDEVHDFSFESFVAQTNKIVEEEKPIQNDFIFAPPSEIIKDKVENFEVNVEKNQIVEEFKKEVQETPIQKVEDNAFNFEKRLQEELEKMKSQIEKDILEKLKKESNNSVPSTPEVKNISAQENKVEEQKIPESNQDNNEPDIDLDEEIRRILS